eukprot:Hpha_TRINITY_DN13284_c0_g2::TRINITY_DN13284_c0_g2_i1::g.155087::m.155087
MARSMALPPLSQDALGRNSSLKSDGSFLSTDFAMGVLDSQNQELEEFVGGKDGFQSGFTDFRLKDFAESLRTAKKVQDLLSKPLNKTPPTIPDDPPPQSPTSLAALLGPSAILDQARAKAAAAGANKARKGGRAARVRALRADISKSGKEALLPGGSRLTERPVSHLVAMQRQNQLPKALPHAGSLVDAPTVVTGPVDYNTLLLEQQRMHQDLSDRDVMYRSMVSAYDCIQEQAHRRLSLLLQTTGSITGLGAARPLPTISASLQSPGSPISPKSPTLSPRAGVLSDGAFPNEPPPVLPPVILGRNANVSRTPATATPAYGEPSESSFAVPHEQAMSPTGLEHGAKGLDLPTVNGCSRGSIMVPDEQLKSPLVPALPAL